MSEVFRCDDKDTLVAYLYGEVDSDVRREVDRHLRTCAACLRETEALQGVRQDLQAWVPPECDLGFSIVQRSPMPERAPVLTSPRWASLGALPAWAQVAAAALFIGIAAGLANVHVRSTPEGLAVTTGWMQPAAVPNAYGIGQSSTSNPAAIAERTPADAAGLAPTPNEEWRRELVALERSLRSEMAAQHAGERTTVATRAVPGAVDTAAILRRVESMIGESEERQRQELATKLIQANRMWDLRRQTDLVNVQRSLGSLQNRQLAVQVNQQEVMNHLRRVSFTPPNQ